MEMPESWSIQEEAPVMTLTRAAMPAAMPDTSDPAAFLSIPIRTSRAYFHAPPAQEADDAAGAPVPPPQPSASSSMREARWVVRIPAERHAREGFFGAMFSRRGDPN